MGQKIVVGPIGKGLRNDVLPFNIDNDSFPVIQNAYQWRGRIRRKRGTLFLGRLTNYFSSTSVAFNPSPGTSTITLNGSGVGNLITGYSSPSVPSSSSIVPGTVTITIGGNVYTDPAMDGTLSGPNAGSINYATGVITILLEAGNAASSIFKFYPNLPVLGLETLDITASALASLPSFPGELGFNTKFSYNFATTFPFVIHNVSFYKNPATAVYSGYTQKTVWTPISWNGQDYQQFWSTNYQGAFWVTNGINVPFDVTNIGMQYKAVTGVTISTAGNGTTIPAVAVLTVAAHGLVIGDFVFINEVGGITGINFETGYVTTVGGVNTITVTFPTATLGGAYSSGGIAQYLTNRSDVTKDCLRFYDGAPVTSATPPVFQENFGWVNFAPPLLSGQTTTFSIADLSPGQYYLVGARIILPFKDRLIFISPVVQTSAAGSQRYLQDTVIYSQNGTPYYTCSFPYSTNVPSPSIIPTTTFTPILVPANQTAQPSAYWEDVVGYGGFIQAGYQEAITTATSNEDVLVMGFSGRKARFVYTGNDIVPFNFYSINSEYGSDSTFSAINFDRGMIDFGNRGITMTTQVSSDRIDLQIPDEVFQVNLKDNGRERITAQRDYINEWVYFSYPSADNYSSTDSTPFPSQTLFYNYRDQSWAIFLETYTTYGQFRKSTGQTWDELTDFTWDEWNDLWDSGEQTLLQPEIIAGNQQGFVMFLAEGTGEDTSLYISGISGSVVTSPNHGLNNGDYIIITGALGTVGSQVNGNIFSVGSPALDGNSFTLNPPIAGGTYLGGGLITRMYVPYIQSRQFPTGWDLGRKTRLGVQQYLLSKTSLGQITLLIFLSQNATNAYNTGPIVPAALSINNSLIYSTVLYTCAESTNLGLSAANVNLQMLPDSQPQAQIWHRINTSLLGDTVQLGFTMSDDQMRDSELDSTAAITGATKSNPCILTCSGAFPVGAIIFISGVVGMTQLNNFNFRVISSDLTTVTIDVDSRSYSSYISGGTATDLGLNNQFAEIEIHSFIIDVSPSGLLA